MTALATDHPDPTFWHTSQPAGKKVYVWGGRTPNRGFGQTQETTTISEFDTVSRSWSKRSTRGTAHPGLSQVASTSVKNILYLYGGNDSKRLCGVLSQLDLETMNWSQLSTEPEDYSIVTSRPMRKDAAGMVYLKSVDGKEVLLIMCGYADPYDPNDDVTGGSSDEGSRFHRDPNNDDIGGWTNELHFFEIDCGTKDSWSVPVVIGSRPEPCADITLVRTAQQQAVFCGQYVTMLIEFGTEALELKQCQSKCLKNRLMSQHSANCLGFNSDRPQLLMCGGHGGPDTSSTLQEDIWLFDIESKEWSEEKIPNFENIARWGHTITTVAHSDWLMEVVMVGGSIERYNEDDLESFNAVRGLTTIVSLLYGFLENKWALLLLTDGEKWTFGEGTDILLSKPFLSGKAEGKTQQMEGIIIGLIQDLMKFEHEDHTCSSSVTKFLIHCFKDQVEKLSEPQSPTVPLAVFRQADILDDINIVKISTPDISKKFAELRGVDVCGEKTIVINNSAQEFKWEDYGFRLLIAENSLPEKIELCTINIKASVAGQYQFPEDAHLVSAIFWLSCDPPCRFTKPITVNMDHCVKSANADKLSFVRAKCTQHSLPYTFKKMDGGQFTSTSEEKYGSIELYGFSGVAAVNSQSRSCNEYGARIYNIVHQDFASYKIDVVVTWNTKSHLTAVSKEYEKPNAYLHAECVLEFESDEIRLEVPDDGVKIHEGKWQIIPLSPPVIIREYVDKFEQGRIIPKCQFSANVITKENIPQLQHKVNLIGAKMPHKYLRFVIDPPKLTAGGALPQQLDCKLDLVLDAENHGVSKHLGRIADSITEWEGRIAEELELSDADIESIKQKHQSNLALQKREALKRWKMKKGCDATYNNLIKVFECANCPEYAEVTKRQICQL